jgi:hypothetical protein
VLFYQQGARVSEHDGAVSVAGRPISVARFIAECFDHFQSGADPFNGPQVAGRNITFSLSLLEDNETACSRSPEKCS